MTHYTAHISVNHEKARRQTASQMSVYQSLVIEDACAYAESGDETKNTALVTIFHSCLNIGHLKKDLSPLITKT